MAKNPESMKMDKMQDKAMIKKAFKQHDAQEHKGSKGTSLKLAKGGKARRFAEGGMTDADQEAADKAAGLAASNKEPSAGFLARLRAGNIDEPGSEAYEKYGAGRGKALRMASAPVAPSASAKMEKGSDEVSLPTMGEDERPAAKGMGAATVPAPARASAPARPVAKPTPEASTPATPYPAALAPKSSAIDELKAYEDAKKVEKDAAKAAAAKKAFTPPSAEAIDKGMEAAANMLGGGASLKAIQALAKKLASSGDKAVTLSKIPRATMRGSDTPRLGNTPTQSTAPYLKEIGNSPKQIGNSQPQIGMKKGGMAKGGYTNQSSPASKRGDGIATKGKTRGKMV